MPRRLQLLLVAVPALAGASVPDGPTVLEVGEPRVVGEGPLVRVVHLLIGAALLHYED